MATNPFPVPPNFPAGLNLDLLAVEIGTLAPGTAAIWPADAFPATYSASGKPGPTGITTGVLTIETARALTPPEIAAAEAHFQTHTGGTTRPGTTLSELGPPSELGRWVFVVDVQRAAGANSGLGAMLYADGTNWRRHGDDEAIV